MAGLYEGGNEPPGSLNANKIANMSNRQPISKPGTSLKALPLKKLAPQNLLNLSQLHGVVSVLMNETHPYQTAPGRGFDYGLGLTPGLVSFEVPLPTIR
ncbi:hypothetical protein ANN_08787 [Periplaneta americana]|uniref:Uncharacterized protein n=1 Tax=Periplaneta americana TaxID=6978 RepID=A0ABQ8T4N7_PERAM|nr:hypothetical protein ANN_08787 [Periplaneta americana]